MPTKLRKPITRRIGNMIVRLDANGVAVRAYKCRTWLGLSYSRIAALAAESTPIAALSETVAGRAVLARLGASEESQTNSLDAPAASNTESKG